MSEWMDTYQNRVNAERLERQAPELKKTAKLILDELKDIERYLYWTLDQEKDNSIGAYNCGTTSSITPTRWSIGARIPHRAQGQPAAKRRGRCIGVSTLAEHSIITYIALERNQPMRSSL